MKQVSHIISAESFKIQICEALGLQPDKVRRLIIDIDIPDSPIPVYVEMYADERILSLDWKTGLAHAKIIRELEKVKGYER